MTLYSKDDFKGTMCTITTEDFDTAYDDVEDDEVKCPDTGICCPSTSVSSLMIKYSKPMEY
jgi:hypothetical protein